MTVTIHHGDCREVIRGLDPVDAVVCDPPYGLKFMGKGWDHGVPGVEFWDVIRGVMKPGAHLLAFGGTRTHHRLMVAIEDAGFEIRDCLMWVYGTGFPKSLDVGKALDRLDAGAMRRERDLSFTAWMRSTGITSRQINEATHSNMGGHYLTDKEQPAVVTLAMFAKLAHLLPDPPPHVWEMMRQRTVESEDFKRREKFGERDVPVGHAFAGPTYGGDSSTHRVDVTAPATDAAKRWDGWGTALKPAWEPIIMARKPLEGTVAANVLKYGVGGLNIDGCRVHGSGAAGGRCRHGGGVPGAATSYELPDSKGTMPPGRWPANLLHDGSQEVLDLFPMTRARGNVTPTKKDHSDGVTGWGVRADGPTDPGDTGTAARFFYCAKASKRERNAGCEGLPLIAKPLMGEFRDNPGRTTPKSSPTPRANHHPTVKPIALMRYLCRLVTPPGGTVLDPFMGSGSTLVAAQAEGFDAIGIDTEEAYCEIAAARVAA